MPMPYVFLSRHDDFTVDVTLDPSRAVRAREAPRATVAEVEAWADVSRSRSQARRLLDEAQAVTLVEALMAAAVVGAVVVSGVGFWLGVWKLAALIARAAS